MVGYGSRLDLNVLVKETAFACWMVMERRWKRWMDSSGSPVTTVQSHVNLLCTLSVLWCVICFVWLLHHTITAKSADFMLYHFIVLQVSSGVQVFSRIQSVGNWGGERITWHDKSRYDQGQHRTSCPAWNTAGRLGKWYVKKYISQTTQRIYSSIAKFIQKIGRKHDLRNKSGLLLDICWMNVLYFSWYRSAAAATAAVAGGNVSHSLGPGLQRRQTDPDDDADERAQEHRGGSDVADWRRCM